MDNTYLGPVNTITQSSLISGIAWIPLLYTFCETHNGHLADPMFCYKDLYYLTGKYNHISESKNVNHEKMDALFRNIPNSCGCSTIL